MTFKYVRGSEQQPFHPSSRSSALVTASSSGPEARTLSRPSKLHSIMNHRQIPTIESKRPLGMIRSTRHGPTGRTLAAPPVSSQMSKLRGQTVRWSLITFGKHNSPGMACRSCLSSSTVSVHTTARFRRQGKDRSPEWFFVSDGGRMLLF